MNLTLTKQKQVRLHFIEKSPEIKEVLDLKKKICDIIYNIILNSLNSSEKWIVENIDNSLYPTISQFICNSYNNYDRVFEFKFPSYKLSRRWDNLYSAEEIYRVLSTFKLDNDLPSIISPIWMELKNLDPTKFKDIQDLMKKIINLLESLEQKIVQLDKLLKSTIINLRDVKKYFPELYNIIKK